MVLAIGAIASGESQKNGLASVFWNNGAACISGLVATHLLRIPLLRLRNRAESLGRLALQSLPWVVASSAALLGGYLLVLMVVAPVEFSKPENQGGVLEYFATLLFCSCMVGVWTFVYLGYHSYVAYQQAKLQSFKLQAIVKEAELRTLKAQINPHFLFNSLNTLRALIPEKEERPREAVMLLADLLRAALSIDEKRTISLEQELETVDSYLALEQLRYEGRLRVTRTIESAALSVHIPPFLLQTLVENAVKYGVGPRREGADLHLYAIREGSFVRFGTTNPGVLDGLEKGTGVGLKNARARLLHLLGPEATLTLRQAEENLVEAEVRVPLQKA